MTSGQGPMAAERWLTALRVAELRGAEALLTVSGYKVSSHINRVDVTSHIKVTE